MYRRLSQQTIGAMQPARHSWCRTKYKHSSGSRRARVVFVSHDDVMSVVTGHRRPYVDSALSCL